MLQAMEKFNVVLKVLTIIMLKENNFVKEYSSKITFDPQHPIHGEPFWCTSKRQAMLEESGSNT